MKNKENSALRTVFWLLGPLIFYELCTETAGVACSLFGTQDALIKTGGGALLALPFLYAAYRKKRRMDAGQIQHVSHRSYADLPQGPWRLRTGCFFAALAGIGACLCLNMLLQALTLLSEGWNSTRDAVYGTSFPVQLLVTVLLAPLAEELLFRGLIRTELRNYMEPRPAAFLGALLFGLYHGNVSQGVYAFLLALCLELVCEWSMSLLPAVFLHAGANLAAVCMTAWTSAMQMTFKMQTAFAVAGVLLTVAALYKTKEVFDKL